MTPDEAIAGLDEAVQQNGEDIVLRRLSGTGSAQTHVDVTCRAIVTAIRDTEIGAPGITQTDQNVVISPTEITNAGWPGTVQQTGNPPFNTDPRIPRSNVDKAIVQNKLRVISFVEPRFLNGTLVRINMRVTG